MRLDGRPIGRLSGSILQHSHNGAITMRLTYASIEQALHTIGGATVESIRRVVAHGVPGSRELAVYLLLDSGHAVEVPGTRHLVASKVSAAQGKVYSIVREWSAR